MNAHAPSAGKDSPTPTGLQLTSLDPDFCADPYPILHRLRAEEPIHRDEVLGRIVFTRHDDVRSILYDLTLWTDPRKSRPNSFVDRFLRDGDNEPSMLLMDEPEHKRLRSLVSGSFTPRAVERWRPRVRAIADRLVNGLEAGQHDLMESLAKPLPSVVIAELLGVDASRHDDFKNWSDGLVAVGFNPSPTEEETARGEESRKCLEDFLLGEIDMRRRNPQDDLLSELLRAQQGDDRLSDYEIFQQCQLLLVAGNVTTTDLIGNGVKALSENPEQQQILRAQPEFLANAVEETLRFDSPVVNSSRTASSDSEFEGTAILKGESLSVSLAAANRDPAIYPDPDRFDVTRKDTHHHAFGGGRHLCLGAHLARLEAQETFSALIQRFRRLEPGSKGHHYAAIPSFRGLKELWLDFLPA
ncbi:MAG: cytochrome P450 [Myxococcota bacterium]|nr:cytochrome P450 [Myxococcota bacterium]